MRPPPGPRPTQIKGLSSPHFLGGAEVFVSPNAYCGLCADKQGLWVFGDQVRRLHQLVERYGAPAVDQACARALYFDAIDGARGIERILERGLHARPLPHSSVLPESYRDYGRGLAE